MKVILYSTNCPKCKILDLKLKDKGVDYTLCTDEQIMIDKGFMSAPMLEVDGKIMAFNEAIKWVNGFESIENQDFECAECKIGE